MTVTSSIKNAQDLTMTITAEFGAGVDRVWQIWADPRQLERWWGPPTFPATFEVFEFHPGGSASYFMTGPDGSKPRGWWKFTDMSAPHSLDIDDGFADENGNPVTEMGSAHMQVTLEDLEGGTRMHISSKFESAEQMEQMIQMGMEEGMKEAMGQIDGILAESSVS